MKRTGKFVEKKKLELKPIVIAWLEEEENKLIWHFVQTNQDDQEVKESWALLFNSSTS